jgi:hypothetical protein
MGETNSREITFEGLTVDGADGYKLRVSYSDGVQYDVAIEDGKCVVTASMLREVGYVTLQVLAVKAEDGYFTYVKKSNIFRAEIRESLDNGAIPTYEQSVDALEKVLSIENSASKSAERAETAAETAESAVGTVAESATVATNAAESAESSAKSAAESAETAVNSATQTSQDLTEVKAVAESVSEKADTAQTAADTAKQSAESAETSAATASKQVDLAKDEVTKAQGFSESAENYAKESENSATKAKEYADNAETYSNSAQSAQTLAETAQKAAETSATNAADSLTSANTAAENAAQSAKSASESADKAESAKTSAESAMNSAKSYADSAAESEMLAKASAESAKDILDSIPTDYTELSEDVTQLKSDVSDIETLINIYHGSTPTSWEEVQAIVRAGLASKVFSIGDQLTCNKGDEVLTWDIIGIDCDTPSDEIYTHSMTLQLHDCYTYAQFDSVEALYYCETELAAGTYNFTLLSGYDTTYGGGKTYQFTTTKAIPSGGQIMFPWYHNTQASATKISTYADNTTSTALETLTVTEGTGGTSLGTADGNTANMNHTHRIRYGSSNWLESDLRMRINSTAAVGAIPWKATTKFARKPSWVATESGFLNEIDADFLSVLGKVKKVTARNTVTDGGGSDTSDELMFLLSRSELYGGPEGNIDEGLPYSYYANYSDYTSPNVGKDTNRIKFYNGAACFWWTRSPNISYTSSVRAIANVGSISVSNSSTDYYGGATNKSGVLTACCIV